MQLCPGGLVGVCVLGYIVGVPRAPSLVVGVGWGVHDLRQYHSSHSSTIHLVASCSRVVSSCFRFLAMSHLVCNGGCVLQLRRKQHHPPLLVSSIQQTPWHHFIGLVRICCACCFLCSIEQRPHLVFYHAGKANSAAADSYDSPFVQITWMRRTIAPRHVPISGLIDSIHPLLVSALRNIPDLRSHRFDFSLLVSSIRNIPYFRSPHFEVIAQRNTRSTSEPRGKRGPSASLSTFLRLNSPVAHGGCIISPSCAADGGSPPT